MLYYLFFYALRPYFSPLNVFRYITVRTAVASVTAFLLSLLMGPWVIEKLRELQVKQYIREEGPKAHQKKAGTPTMGGVLIVAAIVIPALLWADLRSPYVLLAIGATVAFGAIGFVDDYNKVVRRRNLGLSPSKKFFFQVLTCVAVGVALLVLQSHGAYSTQLSVPFLKRLHPNLVIDSLLVRNFVWPLAFVPFVLFLVFVIVGSSNAVNLTDGLDGLAIGCVLVSSTALTVLTYVSSNARMAEYLEIQKIPAAGELVIFCGSLVGACLGFLWFNAPPAQVFMGDTGALSLGVVGISLVQRASGRDVHGRRRLARARRRNRRGRRNHQAGNSAAFHWRRFRSRSAFGNHSGWLVQAHGQAGFSHGAAASPFRIDGMERVKNHRAFLDCGAGICVVFADDFEIEVMQL